MINIKTVIYIDILLLVNFVLAIFLLLGTGLICGQAPKYLRLALASILAGFSTLIMLFPQLHIILQFTYQILTALLIIKICYGSKNKRLFFKLALWYFLLNMLLTGVVSALTINTTTSFMQTNNLAVYISLSPSVLIFSAASVYAILKITLFCFGKPTNNAPVTLCLSVLGVSIQFNAFYDTGFSLCDPFSARAILLVSHPMLKNQLPPMLNLAILENAKYFTLKNQKTGEEKQIYFRFIECQTAVGTEFLPALSAENLCLHNKPKPDIEQIWLAFTKENILHENCTGIFGECIATELLYKERCHQ